MIEDYSPYTLPTINFVGGETQDLLFNVYHYIHHKPFGMTGCTSNFAIVSFANKNGAPILTKPMKVVENGELSSLNILAVTLESTETYTLNGKYIYQITIKDIDGDVEIPKQGILYITNNINKSFIQ